MEPVVDIWWIHKFMLSPAIKQSLQSLQLSFNELSTAKFESHRHGASAASKYMRFHQGAHGQILRISDGFKKEMEQLMMSWFSKCESLIEMKMIRKLAAMEQEEEERDDAVMTTTMTPCSCSKSKGGGDRRIDFNRDISVFGDDDDDDDE